MPQTSLWQVSSQSSDYAELCNALYERELSQLVNADLATVQVLQSRLKSLPHYIKRTAHFMVQVKTPLELDSQNASWSTAQSYFAPVKNQDEAVVWQWYQSFAIPLGLVVPVWTEGRIVLDSIDQLDQTQQRFRTNAFGWFSEASVTKMHLQTDDLVATQPLKLLKPTKKVMMTACAGHCWQNKTKVRPKMLTLRELLLSCAINWRNFKQSRVLQSL